MKDNLDLKKNALEKENYIYQWLAYAQLVEGYKLDKKMFLQITKKTDFERDLCTNDKSHIFPVQKKKTVL